MRSIRAIVTVICLLGTMSVQASAQYSLIRLGLLPGDGWGHAGVINNSGTVLGCSIPHGACDSRGVFLWSSSSGMIDIQIEGLFDQPGGINNTGQVAGSAVPSTGPATAVLREADGKLTMLSNLQGAYDSYAYALNDCGWVVGSSGDHAVMWRQGTDAELIGGSEGSYSYATDVNNNGQILWTEQWYDQSNSFTRSYIWSEANASIQLQPLGAVDDCLAYSISDQGLMVGASGGHAVIWSADGSIMFDLGIGAAYDTNNVGQIVGCAGDKPVIWNVDGSIAADLGALAGDGRSSVAYSINDLVQVVGGAEYDTYGNMEAVLWQPVPEPTSLLALAAGITGLVIRRRK